MQSAPEFPDKIIFCPGTEKRKSNIAIFGNAFVILWREQRKRIWLMNLIRLLNISVLFLTVYYYPLTWFIRSRPRTASGERGHCVLFFFAAYLNSCRYDLLSANQQLSLRYGCICKRNNELPAWTHIFDHRLIVLLDKGCVMLCYTLHFSLLVSFVFLRKIM